ncbi:MAG: hypothetical protein V2I62_00810 [Bacteroidales bacterium]|nr:hypothetical protein [Bacteroidales bacterium]
MWHIKPVLFYTTILLVVVFLFQSCAIEDDSDYSDPRDKFIGTWNVSDQPGRINYTVNISKNPAQSTNVLLNNFADMGGSADGLVVGNRIIIDKQPIGNDFLSNGTGTYISENRLEFAFVLDDGIDLEDRKAVFGR